MMGRKNISGTNISMNHEINMKGPGVKTWSKKKKYMVPFNGSDTGYFP